MPTCCWIARLELGKHRVEAISSPTLGHVDVRSSVDRRRPHQDCWPQGRRSPRSGMFPLSPSLPGRGWLGRWAFSGRTPRNDYQTSLCYVRLHWIGAAVLYPYSATGRLPGRVPAGSSVLPTPPPGIIKIEDSVLNRD